jgi:hypothetical protein
MFRQFVAVMPALSDTSHILKMTLRAAGLSFAGVFIVLAAVASIWIAPILNIAGFRRLVENIGTDDCVVERCESPALFTQIL